LDIQKYIKELLKRWDFYCMFHLKVRAKSPIRQEEVLQETELEKGKKDKMDEKVLIGSSLKQNVE
jgi:hypothetical protein